MSHSGHQCESAGPRHELEVVRDGQLLLCRVVILVPLEEDSAEGDAEIFHVADRLRQPETSHKVEHVEETEPEVAALEHGHLPVPGCLLLRGGNIVFLSQNDQLNLSFRFLVFAHG